MRSKLIVGALLVAYAARALLPAGYMPAVDHGLSVQICPDGFPAQLLHHTMDHGQGVHGSGGGTHHHGSSHSEQCAFAAAGNAPALAHADITPAPLASTLIWRFDVAYPAYRAQRFRIQQPRGPPSLA
jgi:hypothetical protein